MPIRQQGQISIGGVRSRRLTRNSSIARFLLFSRCWLFDDTLLANIRIARPQATRQEVKRPPARRSALRLFPVFRKAG